MAGVSVDIYAASSIDFEVSREGGVAGRVRLVVDSPFPFAPGGQTAARIHLTITPPSLAFKLSLRIPAWVAAKRVGIALNADPAFGAGAPGTYVSFERTWATGDELRLDLPMALRAHKYVGKNQVPGSTRWAYEYGPTLLAARPTSPGAWDNRTDCLHVSGVNASQPSSWLTQQSSTVEEPMRFLPSPHSGVTGLDFLPYFLVADEHMTVYPCYNNN